MSGRQIDGIANSLGQTDETRDPGANASSSPICPYLDTIQRSVLDFDLEATCCETLETGPHIYACLVCGKYFRGRGVQTPAYIHAVQESHYMFCHLQKAQFYCLPDGYEVLDPSLKDIRDALQPTFTELQIRELDHNTATARDLIGRSYLPGFCGLNNPNKADGINVIVQALAHVPPIRDFFLRAPTTRNVPSSSTAAAVTHCFGALVRQLWSPGRFKSHVDPHKLINAVAASYKYRIGQEQMELGEFLSWFLHQLHLGTGGAVGPKRKKQKTTSSLSKKSIIEQTFQGKIRVTTRQTKRKSDDNPKTMNRLEREDDRGGSDDEPDAPLVEKDSQTAKDMGELCVEESVTETHFLQLTLDLTEKPLFRDQDGGLVIPQEPLVTVLQKFDGVTFSDVVHGGKVQRRKYQLLELPDYLILHLARFKMNQYSRIKNPTIVAFPVKNLDLRSYVESKFPSEEEIQRMNNQQLKDFLSIWNIESLNSLIERRDLVEMALDIVSKTLKYDLVANIVHESPADVGREGKHDPLLDGSYKCHVKSRATQQWFEIKDFDVREVLPQQIGISESYIMIFERSAKRNPSK